MKLKRLLWKQVAIMATAMALCGVTACGFDEEDEPDKDQEQVGSGDNEEDDPVVTPPEAVIDPMEREIWFGPEGGEAQISVKSDESLYLSPDGKSRDLDVRSRALDVTPPESVEVESVFSGFYVDNGEPMVISAELADTTLTVVVGPAQSRNPRSREVGLYNGEGEKVTSVTVNQAGDETIEAEVSQKGKSLMAAGLSGLHSSLELMGRLERMYLAGEAGFSAPLSADNRLVKEGFEACYGAISRATMMSEGCYEGNLREPGRLFDFIGAVSYSEVVDKWGDVGLCGVSVDEMVNMRQMEADSVLLKVEEKLEELVMWASEGGYGYVESAEMALRLPVNAVRAALAEVRLQRGDYDGARDVLDQIMASGMHGLEVGAGVSRNEVLWGLTSEGMDVAVYSYPDVVAQRAECLAMAGEMAGAIATLNELRIAKGMEPLAAAPLSKDEVMVEILNVRRALGLPRVMAFMRRHGMEGFADWQYRWPIPVSQLMMMSGWKQNQGY